MLDKELMTLSRELDGISDGIGSLAKFVFLRQEWIRRTIPQSSSKERKELSKINRQLEALRFELSKSQTKAFKLSREIGG